MPEKNDMKKSLKEKVDKLKTTKSSTSKVAEKNKVVTTSKVAEKNKVVTTSKSAEMTSKEKVLATHQAYNTEVDEKRLSKTQKVTIATALGLATVTAITVPVTVHILKINTPFDISISTNLNNKQIRNESLTIDPGTLIADLQPIYREGYVFKGWFKDAACTIPYELNYEIKEDDLVYALLIEQINEFTTTFHYNGQEYQLEIDDSMTIEDVQAQLFAQLGITEEEFLNLEGKYFFGLYKDNSLNKIYPAGYKMTTEDTQIYALFGTNTYRVAFPRIEGVYILDTAGNELSSKTVTHGGLIEFKVFLAEGYFKGDNFTVSVNGSPVAPNGETYSIPVTTHMGVSISGIEQGYIATLNTAGKNTYIGVKQGQTLSEALAANNLTEENTMGFYADAEYKEYIDIYNVELTEDITIYTRMATLDKLTITDGVVKALNTSISGDVVIPRMSGGVLVESIKGWAFYDNDGITSILMPDSITTIGKSAFANCTNILSVLIGNSVTSIGSHAFCDCVNLNSIDIPDSVTTIDDSTFYNCSKLTSITIPDSVTSIGNSVFYGCSNLTSINIPYGVKSIGESIFSYCSKLTNITIPNSVTTIGSHAFYDCKNLISANIGNNIVSIGESAFNGCSSLKDINIPDCIQNINSKGFFGCESLNYNEYDGGKYLGNNYNKYVVLVGTTTTTMTEFTIHDDCKIILDAFNGCSSLTSITIPDSVKSIGSYAFLGCSKLTNITIPDSVTSIGSYTFCGCISLTSITIPDSVTSIGDLAFAYCSNLTSITIGNSVTSIGDSAFEHCSSLTSITIGNSVTSIGYNAFYGCSNLQYNEYDGGKYLGNNYNKYVVLVGTTTITMTEFTIHDDCKIILNAFGGCSSLTSITIPDSVTSIGNSAFRGCSSLTNVTIGNSVTSIGSYAFAYCSSLTSVTFSDPSGWSVNKSSIAISGTEPDLTNTSTNATYLKTTYCTYYWKKK